MSEYEQFDETETGESLLAVLDEITVMVENAKSVPLSSSVLINRREMLDLLDTAHSILPAQIVEADNVLQDAAKVSDTARDNADRVVAAAREKAKQIISQAKAQAKNLVSHDSVTVKARQQAAKILDEAKSKAARITAGANQYSDATLAEVAAQLGGVQEYLHQIQVQIDAGRDVLAQRREAQTEYAAESGSADFSKQTTVHTPRRESGKHMQNRQTAAENQEAEIHIRDHKAESGDAEIDFAAVQAKYAQIADLASESADFVQGGEIQGGEISAPNAQQESPEQFFTAPTAESVPEQAAAPDNANLHSVKKLRANMPGAVPPLESETLPDKLPDDFDDFVPELEFTEYRGD